MSMLGNNCNKGNMKNAPTFHEIKKQASFFLKEKIKTARLALTDVTPAQLLVEEATNGNPGGPDARTLKMISKAAFEVDDYWRIVGILHKRLVKFDKRNWTASYKALVVLEYLLTHGPESVAEEFQMDRDVIREMDRFQHMDDKGFNWGLNVRKKSERILKLLEKGPFFKEERDKARKISRGIEGFGSFCVRTSSGQHINQALRRCDSQFNDHTNQEDFLLAHNEKGVIKTRTEEPLPPNNNQNSSSTEVDSNEHLARYEGEPLLEEQKDKPRINASTEGHHPFDDGEHLTAALSLLST